ncbi:MAG: fructosamine kinase family protein [Myxococcales bacterium]|nr:fructosamine kinase family protein [Myxococcales bacterium]
MASDDLWLAVARALGSPVTQHTRQAGGDINDAYRLTLADRRQIFVKTHPSAPTGMFTAEAQGLRFLDVTGGPRIPRVLAAKEAHGQAPAFLALEWIAAARPSRDHAEHLGRALAALHRTTPAGFGLGHDNFIGSLVQANTPTDTWASFYRERRLLPQLELAASAGRAPDKLRRGLERVCTRMEALVGPEEPPARLHGDLWGGNAMQDEKGLPCLIDPAAYGGHREIDLAMMHLFGGFHDATFRAYDEAFPLRPGASERINLYQLYPLMVHVNLFGGHYIQQAQRLASRY